VRKLKILFLAAIVIGLFSVIGCSKSNNNSSSSSADSIFYSPWIELNMTFQGVDPQSGDSAFEELVPATKVTAAIISKGVVLTYVIQEINNGDTVISNADNIFDPFLSVGTIDLLFEGSSAINNGVFFRYVIIPGNVLTTQGITPKQLKSMSYKEVTRLLSDPAKRASPPALNTQ
jgi:hypothetical protein